MKVSYDSKSDAMYIYLTSKKKKITKTEELEGWIVDYSDKEPVGIEILDASRVLGSKLGLKPVSRSNYSSAIPHKIR